ncbi:MAG: DUF721 domain-containing protein [Hyphomicrobiaceae bacterium]
MSSTPDKSKRSPVGRPKPGKQRFPSGYNRARRVGSFVPKLTKKAFEKYGFSAASLLTDWPNIVGQDLAQYTIPDRLKWPRQVDAYGDLEEGGAGRPGATLMLRVDPARALDIQYEATQLIDRINAYFGYSAIAEIRILQAPVEPLQNQPVNSPKPTLLDDRPIADLSGVEDEDLRHALQRLEAGIKADRSKS